MNGIHLQNFILWMGNQIIGTKQNSSEDMKMRVVKIPFQSVCDRQARIEFVHV